MVIDFLDLLFGCTHRNYTFPRTAHGKRGEATNPRTYVVCLECGKELAYDWEQMKVVSRPVVRERPTETVRGLEAA